METLVSTVSPLHRVTVEGFCNDGFFHGLRHNGGGGLWLIDLLFPDLVGLGGPISVLGARHHRHEGDPDDPLVARRREDQEGVRHSEQDNASTPAWTIAGGQRNAGENAFPGRRPAPAGPLRSAGPDMARPISAG